MTRRRPTVVQVTTTDISLDPLLGSQLEAFVQAGFDVLGALAPGPYVGAAETMWYDSIGASTSLVRASRRERFRAGR